MERDVVRIKVARERDILRAACFSYTHDRFAKFNTYWAKDSSIKKINGRAEYPSALLQGALNVSTTAVIIMQITLPSTTVLERNP